MRNRSWPLWSQVTLGIIAAVILLVVVFPFLLGFCRVILVGP